jgi:pyruvate formate lyase activating enzyme
MDSGVVFNIQRYSLHDGPGIRTVVFLKGCPMRCWWCHNPEGLKAAPELMIHRQKCLGCASCTGVCPGAALAAGADGITLDRDRCGFCLSCVDKCPAQAIEVVGRRMTVQEVCTEVIKDSIFFTESGGGVTISGGEPLWQPGFLVSLSAAFKEAGLHTAVETSGCAGWDILEQAAGRADLFLFDLKLIDEEKYIKLTGVSGKPILENLRRLNRIHPGVRVRIPVIPFVNDDEHSIRLFGRFLREAGIKQVHLLPYHRTGMEKYGKVGLTFIHPETLPPSRERMAEIRECLGEYGITAENEVD